MEKSGERFPLSNLCPSLLASLAASFNLEPEAGYLVDAVWLYALAAGEILQAGGTVVDAGNGDLIAQRLINRRYKSSLGYLNEINELGDAQVSYWFQF
ncbi:hypothetical protein P879_03345 [Paragonimus westermani]|uniref:Uncharacterized protein n=1 Tax=Paragonimus westermani TaxID=34504 RepID=A0A8T0DB64_9TREM|nr:hypothetical protein P879_03345 [Paragonimus westermani]